MEREKIESESKNVAGYFKEYWPVYSDIKFDRTFSLRNWAAVLASMVLHYNNGRFNIKNTMSNNSISKNNDIKNINKKNNDYEIKLKKILKNKKILHIGCGYGYFLEVIESLGGVPFGVEPYCSFPSNLNIIKAKIEDLQYNDSILSVKLKGIKFDAIVAHDLFLFSILFSKENAHKIIKSLKKHLNSNGIMVFENLNEETLLEKNKIEKLGFKVQFIENIANPYGRICSQMIIKSKN